MKQQINREVTNLEEEDDIQATIEFCKEANRKINDYRNSINDVREKLFYYWNIKTK